MMECWKKYNIACDYLLCWERKLRRARRLYMIKKGSAQLKPPATQQQERQTKYRQRLLKIMMCFK
jgi:hypothetical protein